MEKKIISEKNDTAKFAFLPEMVLEHLNHATPNETKSDSSTIKESLSSKTETPPITFEPLADPFIGYDLEPISTKNEEMNPVSLNSNIETKNNTIDDNRIIKMVKKFKLY